MNASLLDRLIRGVHLEENLLPYLIYTGWKRREEPSQKWISVLGPPDADGEPLELVFPARRDPDVRLPYVMKAIELLVAFSRQPAQLVVQAVLNYDRDMIYVRNTESAEENAIGLSLAVDQITNLRKEVQYSTCSERDARPYFTAVTPAARILARTFLFGHTFAGSFGFTVEAPRLPEPTRFVQDRMELGEDLAPPTDIPIERRVVERIARGLTAAKSAERDRDHTILIREYPSGLNSNMCAALVGMSQGGKAPLEFRIAWSPKIPPGEDVAQAPPVSLRVAAYDTLDYAAKELRKLKPELVTISGHVRALTSSDNPLSLGTRRAVVIRGAHPGTRRSVDIVVDLEREDYAAATEAHIQWRLAEVSGILSRSGSAWRLLSPKAFRVL